MKERRIGRRDFVKTTLAGAGGLFLLSSEAKAQEKRAVDSKGKERTFLYRTLGRTGLKLPVINMGVMNSDNPNLIRAALDSGLVLLDTAHGYMGGRNEETIGSVIKGRPRDSFMIGSKVSLPRDRSTGLYVEGATTEEFLKKLDISLKRLGVDHVEILYHHGVSNKESVIYEPVLKAMEKAKKEGKIRFTGISTHMNEPEVLHATVDSGFYDVVLVAYNFQQKHMPEVRSAIARAAQAGIGVVGMKAIRGGNRQTPTVQSASAALKWVLQDPNVHTLVPGFTAFEEMEMDLAVMENPTLTEEEKRTLQKEASVKNNYCQGCGQCLKQCRDHLPVPDLMRAYMYTYDYRNLAMAQDLVLSLNLPSRTCQDCSQCSVKCTAGFNVPAKIKDVIRLKDVPTEFIG
jgi:hypothetical protein